jgi:VIT1/CCC1 family predicted Fe2+/Mn2+ transporter
MTYFCRAKEPGKEKNVMKRTFKSIITAVSLLVVAFFCFLVVGARFDLASNNNVVESAEQAEEVITVAPMAVEDEFSTEEEAEEAEEVVADEEATESVELAMATFTGKMELSIPVNGIALYRQDADDTPYHPLG